MNNNGKQVAGFSGTDNGTSINSYRHQNQNNGCGTILIVDDESSIRKICSLYLSKGGYQIMQSESGEDAVEIFRSANEKIDLVLLDLNMPGIGGYQCLEELSKIDPKTPVLISTGACCECDADTFKANGAVGLVSKPIELKQLAQTIRTILSE
jgi:CheY-like chemotaxis protein